MLFAPLTGMELQKESPIFIHGKRLRHIIFRPTCNQRAVQIQELVARRQNQCRDMADNMLSDLKKLHAHSGVFSFMQDHQAAIERRAADWFTEDEVFRFVLNTTLDLKKVLDLVSAAVTTAEACFSTTSESPDVLQTLMSYFGKEKMSTLVALGDITTHEPMSEAGGQNGTPGDVDFVSEVVAQCGRAKTQITNRANTAADALQVWNDNEQIDEAMRRKLMSLAATLDAANQASPLDAFGVLLERGLGGCLTTVGTMEPAILQRVLATCSPQTDTVRREQCADLPGDDVTVSVLARLLANTSVRTVGYVPVAGIRDGAIEELVLIGKTLTLCEVGLVGHYLHDRNKALAPWSNLGHEAAPCHFF